MQPCITLSKKNYHAIQKISIGTDLYYLLFFYFNSDLIIHMV